jgi:hypothetical protein
MLHQLQQTLLICTSFAFALLLAAMIRSQAIWRAPFFSAYALVASVYGLIFDPTNRDLLFTVQPLLLALRIGIVIEAFHLATQTISPLERRCMLIMLVAIAGAFLLMVLDYHQGPPPLSWYKSARLYVHLGLTAICSFGAICLWIDPPYITPRVQVHGLALILYFGSHTIINFLEPRTMTQWQILSCASFLSCCGCIWIWLRWGLGSRARVHSKFKVIDSVV